MSPRIQRAQATARLVLDKNFHPNRAFLSRALQQVVSPVVIETVQPPPAEAPQRATNCSPSRRSTPCSGTLDDGLRSSAPEERSRQQKSECLPCGMTREEVQRDGIRRPCDSAAAGRGGKKSGSARGRGSNGPHKYKVNCTHGLHSVRSERQRIPTQEHLANTQFALPSANRKQPPLGGDRGVPCARHRFRKTASISTGMRRLFLTVGVSRCQLQIVHCSALPHPLDLRFICTPRQRSQSVSTGEEHLQMLYADATVVAWCRHWGPLLRRSSGRVQEQPVRKRPVIRTGLLPYYRVALEMVRRRKASPVVCHAWLAQVSRKLCPRG